MSFKDHVTVMKKLDALERLDEYVAALPDDERDAAVLLLTDLRFSQDKAARAFRAEGYAISEKTIGAWRSKHGIQ